MHGQAKTFISLIATLFLTACGTVNNTAIQSLSPEVFHSAQNGVAIFSVGAKEPCTSFASAVLVWDGATHKRVETVPGIFINNAFQKSEFSDHQGAVDAIALPPGTYYFQAAGVNPFYTTTVAPTMHFEVSPSETTYIGEIYLPIACTPHAQYEVRDSFERDMAIVKQKNPDALKREPVKRLMRFGAATIWQ